MALFTDGIIATIEDLKEYESSILQTASVEGIDATAKLKLAQREIGLEIATFLSRHGFTAPTDVGRVVVSESLLHWHCLHTLALFYRDAYNSQVNDRYLGKWKEYVQTSTQAAATAIGLGIGMVSTPLSRAATPQITTEPGGGLGVRTYYVSSAWQAANGSTSDRSEAVVVNASISTILRVTAGPAPGNAAGWCIYVGDSESTMRRQNVLPLAVGAEWLEPGTGLRTDLADLPTQSADWYVRNQRVFSRG
jgi:hypothetical protein